MNTAHDDDLHALNAERLRQWGDWQGEGGTVRGGSTHG